MQANVYRLGVMQAFEGELFGAALMRRLVAHPAMRGHEDRLRRIERLERLMGDALSEILPETGDRIACAERAESRAAAEAERLSDYPTLIARVAASIAPALDQFVALADAAPPEHRDIMALLIEHERVLADGLGPDPAPLDRMAERLARRAAGRRATDS